MKNSLYEDSDFIELAIKYIVRDPQVFKMAKNLKMTPDDVGGVDIYRAFITIVFDIGAVPIDQKLFLMKIKQGYESGLLSRGQESQIVEFFSWIYNDELSSREYILEHLPKMLKHRRFGAILRTEDKDVDNITAALNSLAFEFKDDAVEEKESTASPFDAPILKKQREVFGTGFPAIDEIIGGIGIQEYGMILGYSGSGKTAMACHSALQNVITGGWKVLYLTLEEGREDIINRFYANYFSLSYSGLHRGLPLAQSELKSAFSNMTEDDVKTLKNLRVQSLNHLRTIDGGVTKETIIQFIEEMADGIDGEEPFIPQLVYIDQLDYMRTEKESDSAWENYSNRSFSVDELSSYLIKGEHKFSVWLLHQAGGKMKRNFSNADVTGFKGVIKPCDLVIGIGKENPSDSEVTIFSLKSRHTKNFSVDHRTDLEFMRFDTLDKGGIARIEVEKHLIPQEGIRVKTKYKNIPNKQPQQELLPSAGGKFI